MIQMKNIGNMRIRAMGKHFEQKFETGKVTVAASSVSLPNWNASRLKAAQKVLSSKGINVSKTHILIACIRAYLPKLYIPYKNEPKRCTRRKNESRYAYEKISTYCDFLTWDHLFQKCLHNKISISHVMDIAVRLYLRGVLWKLMFGKKLKIPNKFKEIFRLGKYQKIILKDDPKQLKLLYLMKKPPI